MTALELFINHRRMLRDELNLFIEYYQGDQPEVISALASKIEYVCVDKGSPSSVPDMLKSIVKGKLKIWADYNDSYNIERGQQMNPRMNRAHLEKVLGKDNFLKGHFRWNFKVFVANYETRNYIEDFYIKKNVEKIKREHDKHLNTGKLRVNVKHVRVYKNTDTQIVIDVKTTKDNEYRFFFSTESGMQTNCGTEPLNNFEKKWVYKVVASEYPEFKSKMKECL
jgi:hypothetical protein